MRMKYFSDTDTALLEFTDDPVAETREISESIYADLDRRGNLVSMTIEHARSNTRLDEFSYQEVFRLPVEQDDSADRRSAGR